MRFIQKFSCKRPLNLGGLSPGLAATSTGKIVRRSGLLGRLRVLVRLIPNPLVNTVLGCAGCTAVA